MARFDDVQNDRETLRGIVAILLSLALLAERAAFAPRSVRALVLSYLWPAQLVARKFVLEEHGACSLPAAMLLFCAGDCPDDAPRLAVCFRALALAVGQLVARIGRDGDQRAPRVERALLAFVVPLAAFASGARPFPDTS